MQPNDTLFASVTQAALRVLQATCTPAGVVAAAGGGDNYDRIWARDTAVAAIACVAARQTSYFPSIRISLEKLGAAAARTGQIPSNISLDGSTVSFGGPVGRTDASFWWIIAALLLEKQAPGFDLMQLESRVTAILTATEVWEFNYQHLIYVPLSSNWADEYITEGYVLYDQLLRYQAYQQAGHFFQRADWLSKAAGIGEAIRLHFNQVPGEVGGLYTAAQRYWWKTAGRVDTPVASFTPGKIVQRWDAWSFAWLLGTNLAGDGYRMVWINQIMAWLHEPKPKLVPAFFPIITETDADYPALLSNHAYAFKNAPGAFHNGGAWPVIQGFLIAALHLRGFPETAKRLQVELALALHQQLQHFPFPEYFHADSGMPGGKQQLTFSAAGWLLAIAPEQGTNAIFL